MLTFKISWVCQKYRCAERTRARDRDCSAMALRKLAPYWDEVYAIQTIIIHTVQGIPGLLSSF